MVFLLFRVLFLTWCVIRTLRRSFLDTTAKPRLTEASALCKVLGNLNHDLYKITASVFAELMSACH